MNRKKVVVVAEDAGGASALSPVIALLAREGRVATAIYAAGPARKVFHKCGVVYATLEGPLAPEAALTLLEAEKAHAVLAGTSDGANAVDKALIAAAGRRDVFSLALVDYWSNYRRRFADATGCLVYVPTLVAVMDTRAQEALTAEGVSAQRIHVTGHPAFDRLASLARAFDAGRRDALRRRFGAAPEQRLILFVSQPMAAFCARTFGDPFHIGFTEYTVIRLLLDCVDKIRHRFPHGLRIIVRPHPAEDAQPLRDFLAGEDVLVTRVGEAGEVALAADLVVGMDSEFLVEACALGRPTISLQPGLRNLADGLPTNAMGLSHPVYEADQADTVLKKLLLATPVPGAIGPAGLGLLDDASHRVAALLYAGLDGRLP